MTSLQAHLLIASGGLAEPFRESVVLLARHNEEGALGLILNHCTQTLLKDAWEKASHMPCERDAPLYLGGPCEGPLVALHTQPQLSELEVLPGLFFSADKNQLESLATQTDPDSGHIKFFAGYSGWSAGQLEEEISQGSWSVMPARMEFLLWPDDEMWKRSNRFVADAAWRSALNIRHTPPDLREN